MRLRYGFECSLEVKHLRIHGHTPHLLFPLFFRASFICHDSIYVLLEIAYVVFQTSLFPVADSLVGVGLLSLLPRINLPKERRYGGNSEWIEYFRI